MSEIVKSKNTLTLIWKRFNSLPNIHKHVLDPNYFGTKNL